MRDPMSQEIPEFPDEPTSETSVDRTELADIAARSLALRRWEQAHLPTEASVLGFDLFMSLAQWGADDEGQRTGLLKQIYLGLPYSEKGLRLHLRKLEAEGWITLQRASRGVQFELTDKYWEALDRYVQQWRRHTQESN